MGGRHYDQPRPRQQRLKEDQQLMILSRKGIPLEDLEHIFKLSKPAICGAVAKVEETYLAWGIPLPPKAPRLRAKDLVV
jgi:hypothetical protein